MSMSHQAPTAGRFSALMLLAVELLGCATSAPRAVLDSAGVAPICSPAEGRGGLVVYSATYPQTGGQSEYPAHTRYTILTTDGQVMEHVANNSGSFGAFPSTVELPCGHYDVRAQYGSGRFVVVPVAIRAGKLLILDLTREPLDLRVGATHEPIRLPNGQVVGWWATSG